VSWLADNRHWLLFAATVLSGLSAVGIAVVGVLATVSVLLTGGSVVLTAGGFLLATLVLCGLALVFAAALLSTLASRASLPAVPRNQRAANVLSGLEAAVPPLRQLGLADRVEPTLEDRQNALEERYVEGDLSEHQFETALADLLEEEDRRVPEGETPADLREEREKERE